MQIPTSRGLGPTPRPAPRPCRPRARVPTATASFSSCLDAVASGCVRAALTTPAVTELVPIWARSARRRVWRSSGATPSAPSPERSRTVDSSWTYKKKKAARVSGYFFFLFIFLNLHEASQLYLAREELSPPFVEAQRAGLRLDGRQYATGKPLFCLTTC